MDTLIITAAGRQVLPSFERLVMSADAILENTHDIAKLRKGFITIATLPSIAAHLLPAALCVFRSEHPHVQIVVSDVVASRVVQMVKSSEADLGITGDTAKDRELSSELLLIDRLCAFVPRGHTVANQGTVSLRELLAQPLILTGLDSSVRELIIRKVRGETVALTPAYQVNYLSTALGFVEAGLGIAILPESSLSGNANPEIRTVPIEPIVRRRVTLIHRRGTDYSHAAAAFVQCLKRKAGFETALLSSRKTDTKTTGRSGKNCFKLKDRTTPNSVRTCKGNHEQTVPRR